MSEKQREFGARIFAALANSSRLHVVEFLSKGPAPVREIAESVGLKQSITSQHLAILQNAGIVECHPQGQMHYYSLRGDRIILILRLIQEFYEEHLESIRDLYEAES
jgi:DNA-binding transcriptional ArsR family regulator